MLIPPSVTGEERLSFISAQRERLAILLSALDKEANTLQGQSVKPSTPRQVPSMFFDGSSGSKEEERPISSMGGLSTRKSEADFEKIEAESGAEEAETVRRQVKRSSGSASWMPWSWGAKTDGATDTEMSGTHTVVEDKGKSSSVDA